MDFLKNYNLSILAIPAYFGLAVVPHAYAIFVATRGGKRQWDNANSKGQQHKQTLKEKLSPEELGRFERAEAAHANGMENLPVFATAVILGNLAKLEQGGWGGLNAFAGSFLALRVLYNVVYINNTSREVSAVRSLIWAATVGLCMRVIIKSAWALNGKLL